jgi:ubiquitin carboxyl-terminal hydrolase 5/13
MTDEACPHAWDESCMRVPTAASSIFKDDCLYCCRTNKHYDGIYVCMCCFQGVCREHMAQHMTLNPSHAMYTAMKQLPAKEDPEAVKDSNHLGVAPPPEYESHLVCGACHLEQVPGVGVTYESFERIVNSTSAGVQDAVNANHTRNCKTDCPHLQSMVQGPSPFPPTGPTGSEACTSCPCTNNNWMCMTCGAIGCPRKEAGGQQHAIWHFMTTGHPVVFKVGTIVDGHGDLYCYSCDDSVWDASFSQHMKHFGVNTQSAIKTAKTLGEMEYDISSQHDFNTITEAGAELVPKHGPGFTGLRNFGNTCYLSSVVQCLLAQPSFVRRFGGRAHRGVCKKAPLDCHECQLERLCEGMRSGDFADSSAAPELNGITPRSFKKLFCKPHAAFSTGEQQDAAEFLGYLLQEIHRRIPAVSTQPDPTTTLDFVVEQRSQCCSCHRVKYAHRTENLLQLAIPVSPKATPAGATAEDIEAQRPRTTLDDCVSAFLFPSSVEGVRCSGCGQVAEVRVTQRLATFPDLLVLNPRREYFDKEALQVKKLDVHIDVPQTLNMERTRGGGPQPGETIISDLAASSASLPTTGGAEVDEVSLAMIMSMGIEANVATWALQHTGGDVERAIDYVFSHPEGPPSAVAPQVEPVAPVAPTNGVASYRLVAMISHMGANAMTGHYVAHVKDAATGEWVLFNDEKVAVSKETPFKLASVYFYARDE